MKLKKLTTLILGLVICSNSYAATINFLGYETGGNSENAGSGGTFSVQSTVKRTGTYALQVNPTTTATGYHIIAPIEANGTDGDGSPGIGAVIYVRFYFRVDTLPASASEEIFTSFEGSGTTYKLSCRINSDGTLALYDSAATLIGTSSTALSTATWYRIEIFGQTSASTADVELKINGNSEVSNLNVNTTAVSYGRVVFGKFTNRNGQTIDVFYDDINISTSAYPGEGEVKIMTADSDGSVQQWTSGTGSSNWQEVEEIPFSTADYVQNNGTANQVCRFGFVSTSTAGISGTINSVVVRTRGTEVSGGTQSDKVRVVSGATTQDTSGFDHSASFVELNSLIMDTDPNTGSAWTTSALDSLEAGHIEVNATSTRMFCVAVMVDYTPSGSTPGQVIITT